MDIMLKPEWVAFKERCTEFAGQTLAPLAAKYGETNEVPRDMLAAMAKLYATEAAFKVCDKAV